MADPVFALSPISARSSLPTEADYDAIREAFMETARGRWFLTEYAKRNRNADTNLVLDAVSRLEATLASQKQDQRDRTPEIVAAISALVMEARSEAAVLISVRDTPDEDSPALKGVRVLREMAWTLRESGSDGRIPDLLSRQADAIEEGLKAAIDDTARDHLLSIFDRLAGDVEAFGQSGATAAPPPPPPVQPQAAAAADPEQQHETAAAPETAAAETVAFNDPQAAELQAVADAIAVDDIAEVAAEPAHVEQPQAAAAGTVAASAAPASAGRTPAGYVTIEATPMEDMELTWDEPAAAADTIAETASAPEEIAPVAAAIAPEPAVPAPQPMPASDMSIERMAALEAAILQQDELPALQPQAESEIATLAATLAKPAGLSLGESLLEKGIVARPDTPRGDPLAPFKRMTQAERVAFFS